MFGNHDSISRCIRYAVQFESCQLWTTGYRFCSPTQACRGGFRNFGSGLGCGFPWEDSFRMQDPAGFALLKASPNVFGAIQTSCKERSLNIKFVSGQWIIDSLLRILGGFTTLSNCRRRIQSKVLSILKSSVDSCAGLMLRAMTLWPRPNIQYHFLLNFPGRVDLQPFNNIIHDRISDIQGSTGKSQNPAM